MKAHITIISFSSRDVESNESLILSYPNVSNIGFTEAIIQKNSLLGFAFQFPLHKN